MGKLLLLALAVGFAVYACNARDQRREATRIPDPTAGLRGACRDFIQQQQPEAQDAAWGEYWQWSVVDNHDGTFSVGARYGVAGRSRYTTCIVRPEGREIRLVRLARLQ